MSALGGMPNIQPPDGGNGPGGPPPPGPPGQGAPPPGPGEPAGAGLPQAPMVARQPGDPSVADALGIQGAQDLRPQNQPIGPPATAGINHMLVDRFSRLQAAVEAHGGTLYMYSGARDIQQQGKLYQDAVSKYGGEKEARKYVKPPGKSDHDPHAGVALGIGDGAVGVDVRGDLAIAHKLAPHFGLEFDKKQAWHMRIAGV